MSAKILFLHGKESGPHGSKFQSLKAAGFDVFSPDFQGMDLAARFEKALPLMKEYAGELVAGSSYGGLLATLLAKEAAAEGNAPGGLLLLAPALLLPEAPADQHPPEAVVPTTILHGHRDEICPLSGSRDFARAHPELVRLVEVDDEHRLADSHEEIVALAREMISG